jgi:hypothetical protein
MASPSLIPSALLKASAHIHALTVPQLANPEALSQWVDGLVPVLENLHADLMFRPQKPFVTGLSTEYQTLQKQIAKCQASDEPMTGVASLLMGLGEALKRHAQLAQENELQPTPGAQRLTEKLLATTWTASTALIATMAIVSSPIFLITGALYTGVAAQLIGTSSRSHNLDQQKIQAADALIQEIQGMASHRDQLIQTIVNAMAVEPKNHQL